MILYHGSNVAVERPRILISNRSLDFGPGFYTTSSKRQAERWATLQANRRKDGLPCISVYSFPENALSNLTVLQFAEADGDWLDYVVDNRRQVYTGPVHDIVIGAVANDRTMRVINDYMNGEIDKATALLLLEPQNLTDQFCFHTSHAISYLECEEVYRLD